MSKSLHVRLDFLEACSNRSTSIWAELGHTGLDGKGSAYNVGDLGSIPASGRSPGEGNGTSLQYSCLENPMNRGAWWATVHGVAKSWTRLSDFSSLHFSGHTGDSGIRGEQEGAVLLRVSNWLNFF